MKRKMKDVTPEQFKDHIEERHKLLRDLMERYELDNYIDGKNDIRGELVEESQDITPEQVALLGAYTELLKIRNLYHVEPKKKEVDKPVLGYSIDGGKVKELSADDLPEEVKDMLRKLLGDK